MVHPRQSSSDKEQSLQEEKPRQKGRRWRRASHCESEREQIKAAATGDGRLAVGNWELET